MAKPFYNMSEKDTLEAVGSIMAISCGIGKDFYCYVLDRPRGVILPLIPQLILTVARPLNFRLIYLSYAVLSAVMLLFICCMQYCLQ